MARMPGASWRPLPEWNAHMQSGKSQVITHTMVGGLKGTEDYFRKSTVVVESTFGVGGPWDGAGFDGAIWQWADSLSKTDANYEASADAISIETSDGGEPTRPWTDAQIRAIIDIHEWAFAEHDVPRRVCRNPFDPGFGFHAMWGAPSRWTNAPGKTCPGPVRIRQWREIIVPSLLRPGNTRVQPLPEDEMQLSDKIPGKDVSVAVVLSRLDDAEHTINQMRTTQVAQSELLAKIAAKVGA